MIVYQIQPCSSEGGAAWFLTQADATRRAREIRASRRVSVDVLEVEIEVEALGRADLVSLLNNEPLKLDMPGIDFCPVAGVFVGKQRDPEGT